MKIPASMDATEVIFFSVHSMTSQTSEFRRAFNHSTASLPSCVVWASHARLIKSEISLVYWPADELRTSAFTAAELEAVDDCCPSHVDGISEGIVIDSKNIPIFKTKQQNQT